MHTIKILFIDSCAHNKNDVFTVTFSNANKYPVDIKRYDDNWNEELVRSRLNPGQESTHETDFSSWWLLKTSDTARRLKARANGIISDVFTGCHYKAKRGRCLPVTILTGKNYFTIVVNLFKNS